MDIKHASPNPKSKFIKQILIPGCFFMWSFANHNRHQFFFSPRCPRQRRLHVVVPLGPSVNIPIIRNGLTHANVVTVTRTGKWLKQIFEFLLCSEIHFIHHSITPFHFFFPILLAFLVSPLAYRAFVCSVRIPAWGWADR